MLHNKLSKFSIWLLAGSASFMLHINTYATETAYDNDLFKAVWEKDQARVELLLSNGINPNQSSLCNQGTPLMIAAHLGALNLVTMLLDAGADPNLYFHVFSPLTVAIAQDHPEIVTALLKAGADPNAFEPLYQAYRRQKNVKIIKALLEAGANPHIESFGEGNLLLWAVNNNYLEIARTLLKAGANPNHGGHLKQNPLSSAIVWKRKEMVKVLLDAGANPNQTGLDPSPLYWTATLDRPEITHMLLDAGADPNQASRGHTPLYWAAKCKHAEVAKILLQAGAQIGDWLDTLPKNAQKIITDHQNIANARTQQHVSFDAKA